MLGIATPRNLKKIAAWPEVFGYTELLDFVRLVWHPTIGHVKFDVDINSRIVTFYFDTAGYEHNENIVKALTENTEFMKKCGAGKQEKYTHIFKVNLSDPYF